jgi:hypothetical protein
MKGRAFLTVAEELSRGTSEAHWRAAAGRAYYALLLEGNATLGDWAIVNTARQSIHAFVRLRFTYAADTDLKHVGYALDDLAQLRNEADYRLAAPGSFRNAVVATRAIREAKLNLARLDQVAGDPSRRAAAVADIRARWP